MEKESLFFFLMQNLRVLKFVGDEKKLAWGKHWIELGFNSRSSRLAIPLLFHLLFSAGLEKLLETTAGKYSVGDEV